MSLPLSPTVLSERRHYKARVRKPYHKRGSEKWHISLGIIVLCVSVAHFSFTLTLWCTRMTDSCCTCEGLSLVRSIRAGPELRTWERGRDFLHWKMFTSLHLISWRSLKALVELGCVKILAECFWMRYLHPVPVRKETDVVLKIKRKPEQWSEDIVLNGSYRFFLM